MPSAPTPARLEDTYHFFNEINIIAQLSANEMTRRLPDRLTLSQYSVLNWFVRVDSQATPGRLARAFQVSKGTMTNTLKKLEQKGFVTVTPDPASGRRKRVQMTPSGRAARDASIEATFPVLAEFLENMGVERIEAMLPMLAAARVFLDERRDS
jgi:DNA-binding MarR family transcriptional regulator